MSTDLTKIVFDLPHHWAVGGESVWARELGDDLYEVRNVPFYAYGVNFLDVVRAVAADAASKPVAAELVRPSGHSTIRIIFEETTDREAQDEILNQLIALGAEVERASNTYCALGLPPETSVEAVRNALDALELTHGLGYETCEARVEGSFDDAPKEVDENG